MSTGFVLLSLLAAGCDMRTHRERPDEPVQVASAPSDAGCEQASVRPATAAPAEGLWRYEDPATAHRVAALIGPANLSAEAGQVTRTVETLESAPLADTLRYRSDTAVVRLELIPPLARPAAVYPVGRQVMLASYEPCDAAWREPLIRYLRQDSEGRVATDVMLRRDAQP